MTMLPRIRFLLEFVGYGFFVIIVFMTILKATLNIIQNEQKEHNKISSYVTSWFMTILFIIQLIGTAQNNITINTGMYIMLGSCIVSIIISGIAYYRNPKKEKKASLMENVESL